MTSLPGIKPQLSAYAYERFREHIAAGAAHCSDSQLMGLADQMTDRVRRRRAGLEARSYAPNWRPMAAA